MNRRFSRLLVQGACLFPLLLAPSCTVVSPERTVGVERRGPYSDYDRGRRLRRGDADLLFDDRLGVYTVVGLDDYFYLGSRFYRLGADSWQIARALRGPWLLVDVDDLPVGLRRLHEPRRWRDRDRDRDWRHRRDRDDDD